MKKKIPFILVLPFLLISCSNNDSSVSYYIDQNGDYLTNEWNSYNDLPALSPSIALKKASHNIETNFVNASYTCSHCEKFEPIFLSVLNSEHYYFESLYKAKKDDATETEQEEIRYNNILMELQNKYGKDSYNGGIDSATPSIYYLANENAYLLDMYDNNDNVNRFKSYLKTQYIKTNIYHFSNFDAYSTFLNTLDNNALTYIDDTSSDESISFYSEHIYQLAKKSEKNLCYLDLNAMGDEEKEKLKNSLNVEDLKPSLLLNKENVSITLDRAIELINNYYS